MISKRNKEVFILLQRAIGLSAKVNAYYDDQKESVVDMYIGEERPDIGMLTVSTIGLSKYNLDISTKEGIPIRTEFIGVTYNDFPELANVLASCAFLIINHGYTCRPGVIYPDMIEQYKEISEMKHIYFASPFLWDDLQNSTVIENTKVTWLMGIPISDAEFRYIKEKGADVFEELLEKSDVDIYNINRSSII